MPATLPAATGGDALTPKVAFRLADVAATQRLGKELAAIVKAPALITLRGDLGAGKTSLVRAILRARGWSGAVKSPTYTLVESYHVAGTHYHHFDLYRLADPEELAYLGMRDYLAGNSVCFVEWPERGTGWLGSPSLDISLAYSGAGRVATLAGTLAKYLSAIEMFK